MQLSELISKLRATAVAEGHTLETDAGKAVHAFISKFESNSKVEMAQQLIEGEGSKMLAWLKATAAKVEGAASATPAAAVTGPAPDPTSQKLQ